MKKNLRKWNKKVENQPDIFIYDVVGKVCDTKIGCIGFLNNKFEIHSGLASYEHFCQYKQGGKVDLHNSFKEEVLNYAELQDHSNNVLNKSSFFTWK